MELAKYIEHTNLKPDCTPSDIEKLVNEAAQYGFWGICINPVYVKYARELVRRSGKDIKIVAVVNFPLGANKITTTYQQIKDAIMDGADEIDTVVNLGAVKSGNYSIVANEIQMQKQACGNKILKVIIETDCLTKQEIKITSLNCANAGADFVKTSTGFIKDGVGATVENVKLMYQTVVAKGVKVKAAGGIKSKLAALDLINAGATRLGTSSGVQLVQ